MTDSVRISKGRAIEVSKFLSYILRHAAKKEGIPITNDGWVKVSDLLSHPKFIAKHITEEIIKYVVDTNDKQRYKLLDIPEYGGLCIRANQGHTMESVLIIKITIISNCFN